MSADGEYLAWTEQTGAEWGRELRKPGGRCRSGAKLAFCRRGSRKNTASLSFVGGMLVELREHINFSGGMVMVITGLLVILLLVLVLPFVFRPVEHNLEAFLFVMGVAAAIISGVLDVHLIEEALREPILITSAVFLAGVLFAVLQDKIKSGIGSILKVVPLPVFLFFVTLLLGLAGSVITAIIASLVLVEIVNALPLDKKNKTRFDIIACFAIGMGAALTPIGEPLSTIATSKLNADFWYLFRSLGPYIIPGVVVLGIFAALYVKRGEGESGAEVLEGETFAGVVVRALKVYLFVMALVLLGAGFKPFIDAYVLGLDSRILYWVNMVSAVLDNATLTAAEISPAMTPAQIKAVLLGLLISGGMLIPGNIPNIVSAGKLKIGSRDWGALGIPLGLVLLAVYYVILFVW